MDLINDKFYNRDLSWLRFNHRVLQEAADSRNPLLERLRFVGIYSSNLDEFFEVRVSNIRRIKTLKKKFRKKLITKPNRLLKLIKKEVDKQGDELGNILRKEILPQLEAHGIRLVNPVQFFPSQKEFAQNFFKDHIEPIIKMKVGFHSAEDRLWIKNETLYLIAKGNNNQLMCANVPSDMKRFIALPAEKGNHDYAFIEDLIKFNLSQEYQRPFYSIKISRDAELYIQDEYSGNLLEKIKDSLSNRDTGQITRTLIEPGVPDDLLEILEKSLDINDTDVVRGGPHHRLKDFISFPNPTENILSYHTLPPRRQKELTGNDSMFDAIQEQDRLLFFPYEAFDDVVRLLEEAAIDDDVKSIKITLYRTSRESAVCRALLQALKNGKRVFAFIETKARFDEANNIYWGSVLEQHGAEIKYSFPEIKVHSKIMLIERTKGENEQLYAYIGTGNFNEKTAKIYTDLAYLTANKKIAREIQQVFYVLQRKIIIPKVKKLLVSPFNLRSQFIELVENEIRNAKSGADAYIIIKVNSLEDPQMIELLYKANNAGVKIRILVRGICCLVPGIKDQSENIYVTSIVDRFLEHSRVYIFCDGGEEKMYIGSADWMIRNIDHRIEVITPILDSRIFIKVRVLLQLQLDDDVKSRYIDVHQSNTYIDDKNSEQSSQVKIYHGLNNNLIQDTQNSP